MRPPRVGDMAQVGELLPKMGFPGPQPQRVENRAGWGSGIHIFINHITTPRDADTSDLKPHSGKCDYKWLLVSSKNDMA